MNDKYESTPAQPHHVEAMERAWLWMENQADGQSKGGHATFDLMMLREERDALRTAIDATPSPQAAQQAPAQPDLGTLNGLAKQYADSYASPHNFTLGVNGLRQIIQRALPQAAPAAQAKELVESICSDKDRWRVDVAYTTPQPTNAQAASSAVLKAIREANMQLVRTGDDAFMLVPYKAAKAQAAEPVAWLRNTTDPQPHAVTNLKYRSAVDAKSGVEYIPVFAAPQPVAREPLTDEQIKDLQDDGVFLGACRQIVRAIEAAHGIGETPCHGFLRGLTRHPAGAGL